MLTKGKIANKYEHNIHEAIKLLGRAKARASEGKTSEAIWHLLESRGHLGEAFGLAEALEYNAPSSDNVLLLEQIVALLERLAPV